jgi:hypothetical protein
MSVMTMTAEQLSQQLDVAVPDMYVVIAKNSIVGMDASTIAELLGVDKSEIDEIQTEQVYRDCRLLLASEYAKSQVETDFNWDGIESEALKGLAKRVPYEKDTETLLRIASIANKAQRRNSPNQNRVLDPAAGGTRVPITLTHRIVKKLNKDGSATQTVERQISVTDGTAQNPTFEDIDSLLGVTHKPKIAKEIKVQTHEPDFTLDDIPDF